MSLFGLEGWNNLCQVVGGKYAREYTHRLRESCIFRWTLPRLHTQRFRPRVRRIIHIPVEIGLISINLRGSIRGNVFCRLGALPGTWTGKSHRKKGALVIFSPFLLFTCFSSFLTCFILWRSLPSSAPTPTVFASVSLSLGLSITSRLSRYSGLALVRPSFRGNSAETALACRRSSPICIFRV